MKINNKKGFTIVELVIVIAVIAILAAVLIPTFSGIVEKAQESAIQQEAAAIWKEAYALDLSDGNLDGKEGNDAVALTGKVFAYNVTDSTDAWTFAYADDKKIAKFDSANSTWVVEDHETHTYTSGKCECGAAEQAGS